MKEYYANPTYLSTQLIKYSVDTEYKANQLVYDYSSGNLKLCFSLQDKNLGNPLTDRRWWSTNLASVPVGTILPYGGGETPEGFLTANGGAISRTRYSDLFEVYGTAYGEGDGSTTFNLPNFTGRLPQGNGRGYLDAGLPNIYGNFTGGSGYEYNGAFVATASYRHGDDSDGGSSHVNANIDASRCSSVFGNSTTVQPPACLCYFMIKY